MKLLHLTATDKCQLNVSPVNAVSQLSCEHSKSVKTRLAASVIPLEFSLHQSRWKSTSDSLIFVLGFMVIANFICGFWLLINGISIQIMILVLIICSFVSFCVSGMMIARIRLQNCEESLLHVSEKNEFTEYVVSFIFHYDNYRN